VHSFFSCYLQSVVLEFSLQSHYMFSSEFSRCSVSKVSPIVCLKDMFRVQEAPTTTLYVRLSKT
jgi:hypothetical protein